MKRVSHSRDRQRGDGGERDRSSGGGHHQREGVARLCRVRALCERRRGRDPLRHDRGHNLITSTVNGNTIPRQFQFQPRGSMVGSDHRRHLPLTGVTQGTSTESLQNGEPTLTYVNNFRLIGPGPGNNLLVHEVAHMTINGDDVVVQHDDLSIDCK